MTEVERIDNLFAGTDTEFVTISRSQWQTLKTTVLAQQTNNSAMVQLQKMKLVVDEYGECVIKKGDKYYNDCANLL